MTETEMRELDAWIAEYFMGWVWWRFKCTPAAVNDKKKFEIWCQLVPPNENWPNDPKYNGVKCGCAIKGMRDYTDLSMFKPTTSPADAMAVFKKCAEKCDENGTEISITIRRCSWYSWVVECCDEWVQDYAEGPTLELAICLFAQKLFTTP